jgi:hypothetical protein
MQLVAQPVLQLASQDLHINPRPVLFLQIVSAQRVVPALQEPIEQQRALPWPIQVALPVWPDRRIAPLRMPPVAQLAQYALLVNMHLQLVLLL